MPFRYGGHAADGGTFIIMRFSETNLHIPLEHASMSAMIFIRVPAAAALSAGWGKNSPETARHTTA
jgi:hypothetical protein